MYVILGTFDLTRSDACMTTSTDRKMKENTFEVLRSRLTIVNAQKKDSGHYVCRAANEEGIARSSKKIFVSGNPPRAVRYFQQIAIMKKNHAYPEKSSLIVPDCNM